MKYIVLAILIALGVDAQEPSRGPKRAWEWTDHDRIAERLSAARTRDGRFRIEGAKNPELFMRWEIFNSIINAFDDDGALNRERAARYAEALRAEGWDADAFWKTMDRLTASIRTKQLESLELQERANAVSAKEATELTKRVDALNLVMCRERHDAIANAEAIYGTEKFRRFLYGGVAPKIVMITGRLEPYEWERLVYVEGGCQ